VKAVPYGAAFLLLQSSNHENKISITFIIQMQLEKLSNIIIRKLEKKDNPALAEIIRNSLAEHGANKPGTVFFDPTTDDLESLFCEPGSSYFVAELNGSVLGGAGIFPSAGLPKDTCELVKMYLIPDARKIGLGRKLINICLEKAKETGYQKVYLETLPELKQAVKVYEKFGFTYLKSPLGNTGHFGCNVWMIHDLS
jgi:putative acetyltransferase